MPTYIYAIAKNKCMNDYDKNKESSNLNYCDANNLYGWAMSKKLHVDDFKWVLKYNLNLIKILQKDYIEDSDEGYFQLMFNILKSLHDLHNDLQLLPKRMKNLKNLKNI